MKESESVHIGTLFNLDCRISSHLFIATYYHVDVPNETDSTVRACYSKDRTGQREASLFTKNRLALNWSRSGINEVY